MVCALALLTPIVYGELPCPLCMLQRYAMILSTLGALWITLVTAAVPMVAAQAVVEAIGFFDLSSARIDPFLNSIASSIGRRNCPAV